MPNWCENILEVHGPAKDIARFKKQAVGYEPWITDGERASKKPDMLNFHSLVPMPEKVMKAAYYPVIYNWQIKNWGVKWGASSVYDDDPIACERVKPGLIVYCFNTPWAPPIAFLKNVSKDYHALLFILGYEETLMQFTGIAKAKAGRTENYSVDYSCET